MIDRTDERIGAAERLLWTMLGAGIARDGAHGVVIRYLDALYDGDEAAWSRFYHALSLRLYEAAIARTHLPAPAGALLRLIDDDFGATIVDPLIRERISAALVETERCEASLPS